MERGSTATFTLEGRNLSDAKAVIFDAPGISAKISQITDLPEEMADGKFSTAAAVPLAKKQSALLEITVAKEVPPDRLPFPRADGAGNNQHASPGRRIAPRGKGQRKIGKPYASRGVARDFGGHDCRAGRQ